MQKNVKHKLKKDKDTAGSVDYTTHHTKGISVLWSSGPPSVVCCCNVMVPVGSAMDRTPPFPSALYCGLSCPCHSSWSRIFPFLYFYLIISHSLIYLVVVLDSLSLPHRCTAHSLSLMEVQSLCLLQFSRFLPGLLFLFLYC